MKNMNKSRLLLTALLALSAAGAFAQRSIDMEVIIDSPRNGATYQVGENVPLVVSIINHGPDSVRAGDSLYMLLPDLSVALIAVAQVAPIGYTIRVEFSRPFSYPAGINSMCVTLFDDPTTQVGGMGYPAVTVSYKDPNPANNQACATITIVNSAPPASIRTTALNAATATLKLFPNPATSGVALVSDMGQSEAVAVSIRDITGRVVLHRNYDRVQVNDQNPLELNISGLHPGLYFVELQAGSKRSVGKLMIRR